MSKVYSKRRDALLALHKEGVTKGDNVDIIEYGMIFVSRTSATTALEEDVND